MIERGELVAYLDKLLACADFEDYAPNGLQVEGKEDISLICTAVTASAEVIRQAAALKADALLVHHGYFWRGENPLIIGMKRVRIANLLQHNLNLLAYHLPLDVHPEFGNNACLGKLFAVDSIASHKAGNTPDLLWTGTFSQALSASAFSQLLAERLQRDPLHLATITTRPVKKIAWCSGAAEDFIEKACALGVDAYLSGEVSERTFYQAQELGIHYFACGHHATERYGVQALGEHLAEHFHLQHHFIDSGNPV